MKEGIRRWLTEQFGSDEALIADVYAEYVSSARGKMAELAPAFAARDWAQVDRIAHTLKGNALMIGDATLAEVAVALRAASKAADATAAETFVARLEGLVRELD